ncbi:MAG TPA: hypothetical protein VFG68_05355 [Fimbriiglobus sp.]|nr:hypothetical protein [Fimbriiglobus sp.]
MSSIFLELHLPDSTAWYYFSFFLTVALFFQFGRLLTLRNWDLLALFLFGPGLLLILQAKGNSGAEADRVRLIGYLWLLGASAYWFGRCLFDLTTVKRPLVSPNLSTAGLAWLGGSLFLCFTAVAFLRPDPWGAVGKKPAALAGVQERAAAVVRQTTPQEADAEEIERPVVGPALAMACHLAVVAGLVLIGARRFNDLPTGVAAGVLYLLVPYTAFLIGQAHHVWPAALIVWAIYSFRRPTVAGALIGLAAGTAFFPLLLLPVWAQFYRGRGGSRFLIGAAVGGVAGLAATLAVMGLAGELAEGVRRALVQSDWQPWRVPTAESVWVGVHWAYRLPVFILYAGFVVTSYLWPPVRNLGHLLAVSTAVLLGVQFWYADRGGLYVLWYAPLLVLIVLRPNLADQQPVPPGPLPRVFGRLARWLWERARLLRPATPPGMALRP